MSVSTIYVYGPQCVLAGRQVPVRVLKEHEDPTSCADWDRYELTEEEANWWESRRTVFGRHVAATIRAALVAIT